MIQRIQSVYLFLAALALACPLFVPLATASGDAAALASAGDNFFADGVYWAKEMPGGITLIAAAAFAFIAIFLYKNRPRQMQLARGLAFFVLLFCAMLATLGYYYAQRLPEPASAKLGLGGIPILLAALLLLLSYRAIKADENLVRSSDRLR